MVVDLKVNGSGFQTDVVETINKESKEKTTKEGTEEGETSFEEGGC